MEEPTPEPGRAVNPQTLMYAAVGLSTMLIVLMLMRVRQLERENEALRGNYQGVVETINRRKPCNCEEVSQNGTTGLHSPASPDSVHTPE